MKNTLILIAAGTFWTLTIKAGFGLIGLLVFAAAAYYTYRSLGQSDRTSRK